ncbi:MAG: M15 family metallopeptidase [Acidimicrobiia bacterium]
MRRTLPVIVAALTIGGLWVGTGDAATSPPLPDISDGAVASVLAVRSPIVTDAVSVAETSDLSPAVEAAAARAALQAGAAAVPGRSASIGMTQVVRGATPVQVAPAGFAFPMGVTILPPDGAAAVMSSTVSGVIAQGQIVMGRTTADLRGAAPGDVVSLVAANGAVFSYTIGYVAADAEVGGTEIVMSPALADQLGATQVSRVLIWGFASRAAIDATLAANGLERAGVRISRSWSPPSPDSTHGLARTKQLVGEFAYRVNANGSVSLANDWAALNITRRSYDSIPIRASCNNAIIPSLQGALTEVAAVGLAGEIDVVNANTYGGCFYPRFNRVTGNLGFLSRHSWGQAFDTNTVTNAQGAVPKMHCDVVRIFRKWGFAWGGNFNTPDGMHFEYVGERRDQIAYPSKYCPNIIAGTSSVPQSNNAASAAPAATERDTMFSSDGFG